MTTSITVRNAQRKSQIDAQALEKFAVCALSRVLALPGKSGGVLKHLLHLSVILVSDRRMAALHQEFLKIPGATDVITFQDGDIFVSVETAQRNAQRFQMSQLAEVRLYIVHGLLHLHGFDDTTAAASRAMSSMQMRILLELDRE